MKKLNPKYIRLNKENRLYQYDQPIVAITGGIATGKSTATSFLEAQGLQIIDADKMVKSIYATTEAKDFVAKNYPEAFQGDQINFPILRKLVFQNPEIKKQIEEFIYNRLPLAFKDAASLVNGQDFYLYDVPLLFERRLESKVDLTILIYSPREIQIQRLMQRDGEGQDSAEKILSHQMDIEDKMKKADIVINNCGSLEDLTAALRELLKDLTSN